MPGRQLRQRKFPLPPPPPNSTPRRHLVGGYIITTEVVKRFARAYVPWAKLKDLSTEDFLDCKLVLDSVMANIDVEVEAAQEEGDPFNPNTKWILITKSLRMDGWMGMPLPGLFQEGHTKQEKVIRKEKIIRAYFRQFGLERGKDFVFGTVVGC
ncbi:hypothetical protein ABKN59_007085 [Abortiporus biennis]